MIVVTGLEEMKRKLLALPQKVARQYLTKALKAGANVIADAVRNSAPYKTGELKNSVETTSSTKGLPTATVKAAFYAKFIDQGTEGRPVEGGRRKHSRYALEEAVARLFEGKLVGAIKPTYFAQNAVKETFNEAVETIIDSIKTQFETESDNS